MAITVQYHELSGSGQSRHSFERGHEDLRFFLVKWAERFTFATQIAGSAHPSLPYCWCRDIQIDPFMGDDSKFAAEISDALTELPAYTVDNNGFTALVRCQYSRGPLFGEGGAEYPWPCEITKPSHTAGTELSLQCRASSQFLLVTPGAARWDDNTVGAAGGQVPEEDSPACRLYVPTTDFYIDWLFVDEPPLDLWRYDLMGRVNDDEFLGSPAECLLFVNFELQPATKLDWDSSACWTLKTVFRERIIGDDGGTKLGWNHELRNDGIERVKVKDGDGNWANRYPTVDLSSMFTESSCASSSSGA